MGNDDVGFIERVECLPEPCPGERHVVDEHHGPFIGGFGHELVRGEVEKVGEHAQHDEAASWNGYKKVLCKFARVDSLKETRGESLGRDLRLLIAVEMDL
ncbi:MAG: hypothetical protein WED83_00710 [Acidimicrobiia bacterium]